MKECGEKVELKKKAQISKYGYEKEGTELYKHSNDSEN